MVELIELVNCYNVSISNDRAQMVLFPTQIPDCDSHNPTLLDLFLYYFSISGRVAKWVKTLELESGGSRFRPH